MLVLLCTEKVCDSVMVVTIVGLGMYVVAMVKALVGYSGEVFVAVILVGGTPCMGAYRVRPVWSE